VADRHGQIHRERGTDVTTVRYRCSVPNEALRHALAEAKLTYDELARKVGVDPKTVAQWVTNEGRTPQPRIRWAVADALGMDETMLWPQVRAAIKTGFDREVRAVYPSYSMPATVWQHLLIAAKHEIMLCGTSPMWMWYYVPNLSHILRDRAEAGCRVRVIIGEPDSPMIQADEAATGAAVTLSSRIHQARQQMEPLRDNVEVRQTPMGFGRSVYRGDNEAVADWWIHGHPGTEFPLIHLQRRQPDGLFDQIAVKHTEALWETAVPVWPST